LSKSLQVAFLSLVSLALASGASASTVTLGSYGSNANSTGYTESGFSNTALQFTGTSALNSGWATKLVALTTPSNSSSPKTSYDTSDGGIWTAAITGTSWVTNTAGAGPKCSGGSCDADDFYYYETTFTAAAGQYNGSLSVMADDTAEVILDPGTVNQQVLVNFGAIGDDSKCSIGVPNCVDIDTISLNGTLLSAGTNTLEIIDAQTGGSGAGVDFSARLNTAPAPEPGSLLLLGTGLLGLAYGLFRKNKAVGLVLNS
jgi:hypothetical protein